MPGEVGESTRNQAAATFATHIRAELEAQSAASGQHAPLHDDPPAPPTHPPQIAYDLLAHPPFHPTHHPAAAPQMTAGVCRRCPLLLR